MDASLMNRREFCTRTTLGATALGASTWLRAADAPFTFRWIVASSMYGCLKLDEIVPEIPKLDAQHIDVWPRVHGNQREQVEEMGHDAFAALLDRHGVKLGMITRYDLGPLALQPEMEIVKKLRGRLIVTGSRGPKGLDGGPLKTAVAEFAEKMKPHIAAAEQNGVTIGIENHGNALIQSPDSMKWLAEFATSKHIGIALAPYHLPQDTVLLDELIRALGDRLVHFYAWEHGMGCHKKLPKEQEITQMPGRGKLDFTPVVAALKAIDYRGWTSAFMHPVPRGIAIHPTATEVTAEIARAQQYLKQCLANA